MEILPTG
ncbi:hypothetical protein LINPERHAP2_LOCUS32322 [Linum perenne]